jgi:multidrug efflux system membrane fusion protein
MISETSSHTAPSAKSRGRATLVALVTLALAVVGYFVYSRSGDAAEASGKQGGKGASRRSEVVSVGTAVVRKGDIGVSLDALGNVRALNTVTVRTQVNGTLNKIHFTEGAVVQAGDRLADIDPRPYEVQKMQAEGQLARDEASLKNARLDLARYKEAAEAVTQQQIDTATAAVAQFEGAVMTDRAAVNNANLQLTYCRITAPITGTVGLRQVDAGNIVSTGDAAGIVVITQLQPVSVLFNIPENDLRAVIAAMAVDAKLKVGAYDRTGSTLLATGELAALDNQIDPTTGTVKLRANFANAGFELFPNQFVNVRLHTAVRREVTLVPVVAVQIADKERFMYVVTGDNTVERRVVKTGVSDDADTEIIEGVKPGETIVTDGLDRLKTGSKVLMPDAKPAGAEAAKSAGKPDAPRKHKRAQ